MNFIPYIITAASIVGTVANSLQKRWCFFVWLGTNSFWCVHNAINGSYAQALLYAFNFAMAILGLVKWQRKRTRNYRRIVKRINKALNIKLYEWQIRFIFADGEYQGEYLYGRRNGKTLANALKLILSSGPPLIYDKRSGLFITGGIEAYAKEDAQTRIRYRYFCDEVLKIYKTLDEAGGIPLREIINASKTDGYNVQFMTVDEHKDLHKGVKI